MGSPALTERARIVKYLRDVAKRHYDKAASAPSVTWLGDKRQRAECAESWRISGHALEVAAHSIEHAFHKVRSQHKSSDGGPK